MGAVKSHFWDEINRVRCVECGGEGVIWNNADPTSGQSVDCDHCTGEGECDCTECVSTASGGRYRKKPVEIDAFQWDFQDRNDWPEWAAEDERIEETFAILIGIAATGLKIHTPEGTMRVSPGDWIIRGVKGEVYPCKPDIFAEIYERAEQAA